MYLRRFTALVLALLAAACHAAVPADPADPDAADAVDSTADSTLPLSCDPDEAMHTSPCFADSAAALTLMGHVKGDWPACKVVLAHFSDQKPNAESWFMDPGFYGLHDEWYWFRLMNGRAIDGLPEKPRTGESFADIEAIYTWAKMRALPYDLQWFDSRIASPHFYDMGFGFSLSWNLPRFFGIATLSYLAPNPKRKVPEAVWGFSLEYGDKPSTAEIEHFFARLEAILPKDVAAQLRWIGGPAPFQNDLVQQMRREGGPHAARVLTWADLIADGEVRGYTTGITAGRLRKVAAGQADSAIFVPTDLVVLGDVPAALPPVAGILTALPQTPQAHLNLLAAARGTPNAYSSAAFTDSILDGWADVHRAVVWEVQPTSMRWKVMTDDQWEEWLKKIAPQPTQVQTVDIQTAPLSVDLTNGDVATSRKMVPLLGGKCAGLMALGAQKGVDTPPGITCLTVKGYAQHVASFTQIITELLKDKDFIADARSRAVLLEGLDAYAQRHSGDVEAMKTWGYFHDNKQTGVVDAVLKGGGLRTMIAQKPLDPAYEQELLQLLKTRFASLSPLQALRFRSSSTAEDIEGFNGAGVYISESGFLFPEQQVDPKDQKRTVSQALRDVWASYWLADAFEERELAHIDHLSGRMAVAVHPRFDNDIESANGVALLAFAHLPDGDRLQLTLDVQPGSLSVTNPPPGGQNLPEIDRVIQLGQEPPQLQRLQPATIAKTPVLTDAEILTMFTQTSVLAQAWLVAMQAPLQPEEKPQSLTLDLEFRRVLEGWPQQADGTKLPARLVWKQVRTLEHVGTLKSQDLGGAPIPRDVLHAGTSAMQRICHLPGLDVTLTEVLTDPNAPDIAGVGLTPYAVQPFTARMLLNFTADVGKLPAGTQQNLSWLQATATHPHTTATHWDVLLTANAPLTWHTLAIDDDGTWKLTIGGEVLTGTAAKCEVKLVQSSKEAWLRGILEGK